MGIFDKLFGRRPTEELAERLIERSTEIVSAYGAVLETGPVMIADVLGTVADTSELPYPKDAIKTALLTLLTVTKEPALRGHLKLGYIRLANWQTGVGPSRVGVDLTKLASLEPAESANHIVAGEAVVKEWLPRVKLEQEVLIAELRESGHFEKLLTIRDTHRPYLSGLLLRFDEGFSNAIFSAPRWPHIPEGASESVRAGFAAHEEALSIASEAMSSQGKLMVGSKDVSILDGAIGLSYACFIWILLSGYLKDDGVSIDATPLADRFASVFVYLDDVQRKELAKKGMEIFQDMIKQLPDQPNLQEWHAALSKTVQLWLISATSDKRTKEHDEDLQKIFASQLGTLYAAAERMRKDAQE